MGGLSQPQATGVHGLKNSLMRTVLSSLLPVFVRGLVESDRPILASTLHQGTSFTIAKHHVQNWMPFTMKLVFFYQASDAQC